MRVRLLGLALFSSCTCLDPVWEYADGGPRDDAGSPTDAGRRDAGPDAGPITRNDAGTIDGGPRNDGGSGFDGGPGDAGVQRGIEIVSAIYGSNCGLTMSNDSRIVTKCEGEGSCEYRIDVGFLGDTAPGCIKAYTVQYRCEPNGPIYTARQSAESTGKLVFLDCDTEDAAPGTIRIENATYGGSCPQAPIGNAWWALAAACNGKATCSYLVKQTSLGDPAFGCAKSFSVEWSCMGSTTPHLFNIAAEADGQTASLTCP